MSLWIDKYRPQTLHDAEFHSEITQRFKELGKNGDIPHLLVYGKTGGGKKVRVHGMLYELYGPGVEKVRTMTKEVVTTSNRKVQVYLLSSNYHIEITPSDVGIYDRFVLTDILKDIAQTSLVNVNSFPDKRNFYKTVVINNADRLSREAQAALRRMMEKYSKTVRIILIASSASKILSPIRSRTLLMRVPLPNLNDIQQELSQICIKENIHFEKDLLEAIAKGSNRNFRKAIMTLQATYAQHGKLTSNTNIAQADYEVFLSSIVDDIFAQQSLTQIAKVRGKITELLVHCIHPTQILRSICILLLQRITDTSLTPEIVRLASIAEANVQSSIKAVYHIDWFVASTMYLMQEKEI